MSALLDVMRARRSVRTFKPNPPPRAAIVGLIEAAITAPSASNRQPWRFLIVSRRATIVAMADAVRAAIERIGRHVEPASEPAFRAYGEYFTRFEAAPVVIAPIFRGPPTLSNLLDAALDDGDRARIGAMERDSGLIGASLAIENLLLCAHDQGLGASAMTGPLVAEDRLRAILAVPPSWGIVALIPIGYPAEVPSPTERKSAEQVIQWIEERP